MEKKPFKPKKERVWQKDGRPGGWLVGLFAPVVFYIIFLTQATAKKEPWPVCLSMAW